MNARLGVLGVCLLTGCAGLKVAQPVGYLIAPDEQADTVMVADAVTLLWPHCTKEDYGQMQMDVRETGPFAEALTAGLVTRGCNVASGTSRAMPTGTTIISYVVDSGDDPSERRLMVMAAGSKMSRLYTRLGGQWVALASWSKGSTP
jgi:hypothetical protein